MATITQKGPESQYADGGEVAKSPAIRFKYMCPGCTNIVLHADKPEVGKSVQCPFCLKSLVTESKHWVWYEIEV